MADIDTQFVDLISGLQDYDVNVDKYKDRLSPYSYQAPKMSFFDLASDLGAGILSTPNTGRASLYTGLGAGFTRVSDRLKKNQEENEKARQEIGLQAARLAMQDEQSAADLINQYAIKKIDAANKKVDYIRFEYDEVDENGETVTKAQTFANIPSNKSEIDDIINNKNGRKVDSPETTINMPGDNTSFADKEALKSINKESDAYEAKSKASDAIRDQVNQAFLLAQEIKQAGGQFGPLAKSFLGVRELISGLGYGDFLDAEAAIAPQKALNQLSMGFTMAIVSQTKGAISDREMKLFISASPTLGSTEQGYMKQLELLERLASRDKNFYKDYVQKMIDLEDDEITGRKLQLQLDKFTSEWAEENPLFTEDETEMLEGLIESGEGLATDFIPADFQVAFDERKKELARKKALLPTVTTREQYDELESGDEYIDKDGNIRRKP